VPGRRRRRRRALARLNSVLPDDGGYTKTCQSCFNVSFNVKILKLFLRQFTCASVGK
jgi:hypothetical protein